MKNAFARNLDRTRGSYNAKRRRRRIALISAFVAALFGLGWLGLRLARSGLFAGTPDGRPVAKSEIIADWEGRKWVAVLESASSSLRQAPLDPFYLAFKGLASYYEAMELPEGEERSRLVDESVVALRKALLEGRGRTRASVPMAEMEYVLGKAYYFKGPSFADAAVESLETSLSHGYEGEDSREYLALSYMSLGESAKALENFEAALSRRRSDLLLVATARTYIEAEKPERAETLLLEAVASSADVLVREKARFLLMEIYMARGSLKAAEGQLVLAIEADPDSAEAHYRLGLVYQAGGDIVRARAEWRRAVSIDPMHNASRQKLAEKP